MKVSIALVIVSVIGSSAAAPIAAQYPTEPPPPAPMRPLQLPPFEDATLANGLQIVLVENRELPLVSISLTMPGGSSYDPENREGLAEVLADLLTKGTTNRSAEEIAAQIEGVGSSLSAGAGTDFFSLSTTVLKEHLGLAFGLMGDVLTNATFPEEELDLTKTRMLSALQAQEAQPGFVASRIFASTLYGDHPYGRTTTSFSVQAITRDDVVSFARARLVPEGAILVVAGDISMSEARTLAERHLGTWRGRATDRRVTDVPRATPTEILLVNRPGSPQSNILVGNLTMRPGDPDYYPAVVANKVLGGGTDARLFLILREEKGWTYGAYSSHSRPQGIGRFQASAEVRTEVTDSALGELLHQLRRMRTEPVPTHELEAARGFLIGSFPLGIQTPQQIAGQVRTVRLLGLGDEYLSTYRDRLSAVTPDDIIEVSQRFIRPDSAVVVVVGDGAAIYDDLAAIAPVRIIDADGTPLTPEDLNPTASQLTLDLSRITARRDSFQIAFQGQVVGTQVSELTMAGDSVVFHEVTSVALAGMEQSTTVVFNAALTMRSVDQTMVQGPLTVESSVRFTDGRAVGQGQNADPQTGAVSTTDIDTEITESTYELNALQPILPALDIRPGATITINVLNASDGSVRPITLTVGAPEEVVVPAGTFSAYRIEMAGGPAPALIFASTDDLRVVKIQPVGQPIAFELVQ